MNKNVGVSILSAEQSKSLFVKLLSNAGVEAAVVVDESKNMQKKKDYGFNAAYR